MPKKPSSSPVSDDLVLGYLHDARSTAKTELERAVLRAASDLAPKRPREILAEADQPSKKIFGPTAEGKEVDSIKNLILVELHNALCKKSQRYREAVSELKKNASLLIAAVAGYIAHAVGLAVGVITGLTAALLRLVFQIGIAAFCKRIDLMIKSEG